MILSLKKHKIVCVPLISVTRPPHTLTHKHTVYYFDHNRIQAIRVQLLTNDTIR